MQRLLWGLLASIALLLGSPSVARADITDAKRLYESGRIAYNLNDFKTALDLFKRAYTEHSEATLLYNIAQCDRQLGLYSDAEKSYRAFLRESPNLPQSNVEDVKKLIATMAEAAQQRIANQPPTGTESPRVPTTNGSRSPEPAKAPATTTRKPKNAAPTLVERRPPRPMLIGGLTTAAVGVAMVAVGIAFGVLAKNAGDTLSANDNARLRFDPALYQAGQRDQILEGVFVGIGAAAVVAGGVVAILGARHRSPSRAALVTSGGSAMMSF
jgi:tetratricopeptide (TPR) repeat protein